MAKTRHQFGRMAMSSLASLFTLAGMADGHFTARVTPIDASPAAIATADLDGDGLPDTVIVQPDAGTIQVAFGSAAECVWLTHVATAPIAVGVGARDVAIGDLDGDTRPDLVVVNPTARTVTILTNDGGLTPTFTIAETLLDVGPRPRAVATGDFVRGGSLDVVVVDEQDGGVRVIENQGGLVFDVFAPIILPEIEWDAIEIDPEDVDEDGFLEIIIAGKAAREIIILFLRADGTKRSQENYSIPDSPVDVRVVDVTGDGQVDIIAATTDFVNGSVTCIVGGSGELETFPVTGIPNGIEALDVDDDCDVDIVVSVPASASLTVFENTTPGGAPLFVPRPPIPLSTTPVALSVRDLNLDGRQDLVVAETGPAQLEALLLHVCVDLDCDGQVGIADLLRLFSVWGPCSVCPEDLDGDGEVGTSDLLIINSNWGPCPAGCGG